MSLRVGLGASQADLDVQGEIDFDFFAESETISNASSLNTTRTESPSPPSTLASPADPPRGDSDNPPADLNTTKVLEPRPACFSKPVITVSCDDLTGRVQKTSIEAVIPTPFNYAENKPRKSGKTMMSPKLKGKAFNHQLELDVSDDSSVSSMSESESDLSATDDSSVDLNEDSDSMTDVTPLMSPYQCYSPLPGATGKRNPRREESPLAGPTKDRVKFSDNSKLQGDDYLRCQSVDINELLKAVKRLEVGEEASVVSKPKSASPSVITQNMRCRKNLSFSNDEVRRIDNDNHVLLKKINAQKHRSRAQPSLPVRMVSSASVNRQRNQRSIELENMAILKRLESTKASKELRRNFLLKEYESRSAGVLSRASSRASKTNSERASVVLSGRSSAASTKSSCSSASIARTAKP